MALKLVYKNTEIFTFTGGSATRVGQVVFLRFRGCLERNIQLPEEYRPRLGYIFQLNDGGLMDVKPGGLIKTTGLPADFKLWHTASYPLP